MLSTFVYICIRMYTHVCTYIHVVYISVNKYTRLTTFLNTSKNMYTQVYAGIYTYANVYTDIHKYAQINTGIQ